MLGSNAACVRIETKSTGKRVGEGGKLLCVRSGLTVHGARLSVRRSGLMIGQRQATPGHLDDEKLVCGRWGFGASLTCQEWLPTHDLEGGGRWDKSGSSVRAGKMIAIEMGWEETRV